MIDELRPGLYRWSARHPAWKGGPPGSVDDWPQEVGCVAYAAADQLVLIDPLVPEELWPDLDALVERHGPRVNVLTTVRWHRRSRQAVLERYGATHGATVAGVEPIAIEGADETEYWLPEPRALVVGDRLLGTGDALRLCPPSWLDYIEPPITAEQLRARLRPLADLPAEMVLASHGDPVLTNGRAALGHFMN